MLYWQTRAHFHFEEPKGSGRNSINGEPQHYADRGYTGNVVVSEITGSCLVQYAYSTAALSPAHRALVPDVVGSPGTKMPIVSSYETTYADNPLTHGSERWGHGVAAFRMQNAGFTGAWGAGWWYAYNSSELDGEEHYRHRHTFNRSTGAYHSENFAMNNGHDTVLPYDLSEQFTIYTFKRTFGSIKKYINGELVYTHATSPQFDNTPLWAIFNIAVIPSYANDPQTHADLAAGKGVQRVDFIKHFEFTDNNIH